MRQNNSTLNTILRLLRFLKPYWKKGVLAFGLMMLSVGLQLPMPFLTKYLLDEVVTKKSFRPLNVVGLALAGVLVVRVASSFLESFLLTTVRARILFDIRIRLFEHVQRLPLSYSHRRETGYLMSRLSGDVTAVQGLLADTLLSFCQNALTFVAGIVCALYIHPKLAMICFGILPLYLISLGLFSKKIRTMSYDVREGYAMVQKDLQELLSARALIKTVAGERRSTLRLMRSLKEALRRGVGLDITSTAASLSSVMIASLGPIVLIWYGCSEIIRGNLTVGGLVAFNSFIRYLFGPTRTLFNLNIGVQRSLAACERIFEMLDIRPERMGTKDIKIRRGRIVFEGVSFSYDGEERILDNVSFEVKPGEVCAIIGRSGVGKTTLVSLIPRFYEPEEGRILLDGQNIKDANLKKLRRNIGIVAQDIFLLSDTIKANIEFGAPRRMDKEIYEAARLSHIEKFIESLPQGYETRIGERGVTLSGGQRQRLAIARAILADPRILILDEATSALDSESERLIQERMGLFMKRRTTLVIAHRLSTIRNADKVIILDDRRIIGEGRHSALYESSSVYRELCDGQLVTPGQR